MDTPFQVRGGKKVGLKNDVVGAHRGIKKNNRGGTGGHARKTKKIKGVPTRPF